MKRSLFCILFLLSFNFVNIAAIENNQKNEPQKSWYQTYFTIKEMIKVGIATIFYIDCKKMDKAQIACSQCHVTYTAFSLWDYLINHTEESVLQEFMSIAHKSSVIELTSFVLQTYQNLNIPCYYCRKCYGYYIREPQASSDK